MELNTIISRINACDARISREQYAIAKHMVSVANCKEVGSFDKFIKENSPFTFGGTTAKAYLLVGRMLDTTVARGYYTAFAGGKSKDGVKYAGVPYTVVSLLAKATKDSPKHFNNDKVAVLCKSLDIVAQYNETKAKAFNKACAEDGYKIDAVEYHERLVRFASDDSIIATAAAKTSDKDKLLAYIKRAIEHIDSNDITLARNVLCDAVAEYEK